MNKKQILGLSIGGIIVLALAIVFYFYDLTISKSFASDNPPFIFNLLDAVGEFPIYLGPVLFGLIFGFTSENKNRKVIFHLLGLITMYIASIKLVSSAFEIFYHSTLGIIQHSLLALESLLIYVLLMIVFSKIKNETLVKLREVALIYFVVSILSFSVVSAIKFIWGRTRFYALSGDYSEYTNFLTIDFLGGFDGGEYRSFPSGHTNAAASSLIFALIPMKLSNKKWIGYLTFSICFLYTVLVAVSRVGVGDHYASDVLFGFVISFSCTLATCKFFKKRGWLHVRND